MEKLNLDGKTAVVTGGNRGIGKSIALELSRCGAKVAICGRDSETLGETAGELNQHTEGAFCRQVDVRSEEQQAEFFDEIKNKFGRLDICVPNAGRATLATATETTLEDWNLDIETNLTGLFITSKMALEMMKEFETG